MTPKPKRRVEGNPLLEEVPNGIILYLRTFSALTQVIVPDLSITVKSLKFLILNILGIPVDDQFLLETKSERRINIEDRTLASYAIQPKSLIFVYQSVRGC